MKDISKLDKRVRKSLEEKAAQYLSAERIETLKTIRQHTAYDDFNIFSMDIKYDYDLDALTPLIEGMPDTQDLMERVFNEALPGISIDYQAPDYGCSAFVIPDESGAFRMGRSYDFKFDSSAMLVRTHPRGGYRSVSFAALDNVMANDPLSSPKSCVSCLTAPFIPLDGINEKGVSIAVLTLDSEPCCQRSGKPVLFTTLLIRMVLDRAATTEEAVELIDSYDVFAISGRDYHFFITDASGDGRVVEFDCATKERKMVATPTRAITNFFRLYTDKVLPHQKNGVYGHGRERYDAIEAVLESHAGVGGLEVAWEALRACAQDPNPVDITSNTQWSVIYNNTTLDFEIVLRRRWDDVVKFEF